MCGITGIVNIDKKPVEKAEIERMNRAIRHRGPDDHGIFTENNVGFGHTRLSIIDLSSRGHQPMSYQHAGHKVVITFNGEIYNFRELRDQLIGKGYRFYSQTDTEVILASYLEFGVDCVKKFNGMFAFVIYDPNNQLLFGARDRFGKKPLKYFRNSNAFVFSSELKSILTRGMERRVDYEALDDFLTLQYVPSPKTGFKGIFKLPQASYFIFNLETEDFQIKPYYQLDYSYKRTLHESEWLELIETSLSKAVKRRLVADVPLGAFLSGGVDSSAIVAFASKFTSHLKTFSVVFDQPEFDESRYARAVAKLYGTEHTEFRVQADDLLSNLDDIAYQFEEPYADSSSLPTSILSKLTRERVTVALSGDAGDENFGGYDKYRYHLFIMKYGSLLRYFRQARKIITHEKLSILFKILNFEVGQRHYNFTNHFDEFSKGRIYRDEFYSSLNNKNNLFDKLLEGKQFYGLDKIYYLDFTRYLPDDLNVKVDLASMRYALEIRSPLLDYELVNQMAQIPWQMKTGLFGGKLIFKKMLKKYLPNEILSRKKHGFSVPLKHWFRNELNDYVKRVTLDDGGLVVQIMKQEEVAKLIKEHEQGIDRSKKLWTLMMLNLWHEKYFK